MMLDLCLTCKIQLNKSKPCASKEYCFKSYCYWFLAVATKAKRTITVRFGVTILVQ